MPAPELLGEPLVFRARRESKPVRPVGRTRLSSVLRVLVHDLCSQWAVKFPSRAVCRRFLRGEGTGLRAVGRVADFSRYCHQRRVFSWSHRDD